VKVAGSGGDSWRCWLVASLIRQGNWIAVLVGLLWEEFVVVGKH